MNPTVTLPSKEVIINHFEKDAKTVELYQRYSKIMNVIAEHLAGQCMFLAGIELGVLLELNISKIGDMDTQELRGPLIAALKTCSCLSRL